MVPPIRNGVVVLGFFLELCPIYLLLCGWLHYIAYEREYKNQPETAIRH